MSKRKSSSNGTSIGDTKILTGDCREILPLLEPDSVQCCVTSPPYWGLRDYEHAAQIGAEKSPEQYVENLVGIFREVRRVLCKDGDNENRPGPICETTGCSDPMPAARRIRRCFRKNLPVAAFFSVAVPATSFSIHFPVQALQVPSQKNCAAKRF